MTQKKLPYSGNGTIDRYPLPRKGKLRKIVCISKEVFKKLKVSLDGFTARPKPAPPKPKTPFRKKPPKKEALLNPRSNDLEPSKDKCTSSFEPSNIMNTRNSSFWRLRNLNDWFKELESYEDPRYIKGYKVKI
ncbi:hypothetical protein KAW50_07630 [candidate division WOR-3 bacterium]|nr:hypothetical protein [candidate division WOR-3 bacterium]